MHGSWRIRRVARVVREGGVIAYPTEAVWGLGCDPWNEVAVDRLLALKERPVHKGLILVADSIEQFGFLLDDLPERWIDRLASTWPGPNTWLVPHQNRLPEWIAGQHDTVALRVSDHPLLVQLRAAPQTSEGLALACELPIGEVLVALTDLELQGLVACEAGRWVHRVV